MTEYLAEVVAGAHYEYAYWLDIFVAPDDETALLMALSSPNCKKVLQLHKDNKVIWEVVFRS